MPLVYASQRSLKHSSLLTELRIKIKSHLYIWEDIDQQFFFNLSINNPAQYLINNELRCG